MNMIKLTRIDECSGEKMQWHLNPEHIISYSRVGRDTYLGLTTGDYATVTQTPARILKLVEQLQRPAVPADPYAGLDKIVLEGDAAGIDEMLAVVELIPGEMITLPDMSAPATVMSTSQLPGGSCKIVLEGQTADFGHVRSGDAVRVSTVSERIEKYIRMSRAAEERDRLMEAGVTADPRLVTVTDLAHLLGLDVSDIIGWIEDGLPIFESNITEPNVFNAADVHAWLVSRVQPKSEPLQTFFV